MVWAATVISLPELRVEEWVLSLVFLVGCWNLHVTTFSRTQHEKKSLKQASLYRFYRRERVIRYEPCGTKDG